MAATRKQRATAKRIKQEHLENNFSQAMYFSCIELYARNKPGAIEIASEILGVAFFLDRIPQQARHIGAAEFAHFANACR